jgi:3-oxoacyl-[acyl-carrier-protein] synthase II
MTQTTARGVGPLRIAACGVVSPAGYGLDSLGEALRDGRSACADPAEIPGEERLPDPIRAVPGLRAADHLGRKGTRFLDRTNTLGLVASKMALESLAASAPSTEAAPSTEGVGVVMGTSTGSVRSSSEFARDTFVEDRPYLVNPGSFPNTVMNSCAGQIAIWNSLYGVNATFSGGQLSSLQAIRYARNALEQRQADRLITGGVEELSPQTAWAWRQSGALPADAPVGEGCAVFVLERGDGESHGDGEGEFAPLVELLACDIAYAPAPDRRPRLLDGLTNSVERAVRRSQVDPGDVTMVSLSAASEDSGENRIEERAVERVLGRVPQTIRVKDVVGECYSASGALQLAALVAHWRRDADADGDAGAKAAPGDVALITSVGRDGNVGCLVARYGGDR